MNWFSKFLGAGGSAAAEPWPEGALVVDVRSPAEYQSGHVEGALNLPLNDLPRLAAQHLPDKAQPLVLYCQSGMRSESARQYLQSCGYTQLVNGRSPGAVALRLQRNVVRG
ncbi:rhodanese-like domain-containing protein [Curvibacter gracilis]|uniref:rhodanese-like domain-containing protein n=1 Tax=Curvibacter gracilis TaxID=230310 RepID=UPI0004816ACB|nr:rhodanese-like domain-containing protein [Curvibacter gracilis]